MTYLSNSDNTMSSDSLRPPDEGETLESMLPVASTSLEGRRTSVSGLTWTGNDPHAGDKAPEFFDYVESDHTGNTRCASKYQNRKRKIAN